MASDLLSGEKKKDSVACFEKDLTTVKTALRRRSYHYIINKKQRSRRDASVPEARALITAMQAENNLHYLFQETQYNDVPVSGRPMEESSHGERDRRRTGCLVINSVLFGVDFADHFGKFGSQLGGNGP